MIRCDVLVVGGGFSGISALYRLRKLGYNVKLFEAGSDFGGVWYCIPEAWKNWNFSQRFPDHVELRRYFDHLDKTLVLRKDCQFEAKVNSCRWDESKGRWNVTTEAGHKAETKYLYLATGLLYRQHYPDFPRISDYKGEIHHSGSWPESLDTRGKKIALIGAGATAVQITQELAKSTKDGGSLTVFMRRPSNCLPMQQRQLTTQEQTFAKAWYSNLFKEGRQSRAGFLGDVPGKKVFEATEEEREDWHERMWQRGGFHPLVGGYADTPMDIESNKVVYDFWRKKVRERIKDPKKQDLMAPEEMPYPFGTKRTPLEHDYYESLDMPHVDIVNLNETQIESFTQGGMKLKDEKEREYDIVVLATGFDSFSGSLTQMGLKNRDGVDIKDVWADGISSYLGMVIAGFPNAFMVYSPQAPTALSNGPTILECQSDFVASAIQQLESEGARSIEATPEAAGQWTDMIEAMCAPTLLPLTSSWWTGGNIPGKRAQMLSYPAGIAMYEQQCRDTLEGWKGFVVKK